MSKKTGLIQSVKPLLDQMVNTGRWYSEAVYQQFLRDSGEFDE
jgi:predicted nucleic acid-binding protein